MKKTIYFTGVTVFALLASSNLFAQQGIGTDKPHKSSVLELKSSKRGLLIPRVNLTGTKDVLTIEDAADALLVYNLADTTGGDADTTGGNKVSPGFYFWHKSSGSWKAFVTGSSTSFDALIKAENGIKIDTTDGKIKLGGDLTMPTVLTTDAANTLSIVGLQPGTLNTKGVKDLFVVQDANGVFKNVKLEDVLDALVGDPGTPAIPGIPADPDVPGDTGTPEVPAVPGDPNKPGIAKDLKAQGTKALKILNGNKSVLRNVVIDLNLSDLAKELLTPAAGADGISPISENAKDLKIEGSSKALIIEKGGKKALLVETGLKLNLETLAKELFDPKGVDSGSGGGDGGPGSGGGEGGPGSGGGDGGPGSGGDDGGSGSGGDDGGPGSGGSGENNSVITKFAKDITSDDNNTVIVKTKDSNGEFKLENGKKTVLQDVQLSVNTKSLAASTNGVAKTNKDYTVEDGIYLVLAKPENNEITVKLPKAKDFKGRKIVVVREIDNEVHKVIIDGQVNLHIKSSDLGFQKWIFISDGTTWVNF